MLIFYGLTVAAILYGMLYVVYSFRQTCKLQAMGTLLLSAFTGGIALLLFFLAG